MRPSLNSTALTLTGEPSASFTPFHVNLICPATDASAKTPSAAPATLMLSHSGAIRRLRRNSARLLGPPPGNSGPAKWRRPSVETVTAGDEPSANGNGNGKD